MAWWSTAKKLDTVLQNDINVITMINGESHECSWGNLAEIYFESPHIRAIEDYKAKCVANAVFRLYKKNSKTEDEELFEHPILTLINNPNPYQNGQNLMAETMIFENIYGESFVRGVKGLRLGFGNSVALWNLCPRDIVVYYKNNGIVDITSKFRLEDIIDRYDFSTVEGVKQLFSDEVIHGSANILINSDYAKPKDTSEFQTLKQCASNLKHIQESRGVVIKNRGAIGMLTPATSNRDVAGAIPLTPDQKKEMLKEHQKLYGLTSGKHPIMIPTVSMDWKNMILPIKDLQLDESTIAEFNTCCDLLGVPRGIFDDQTSYANQSAIMRRLYQDTIIPFVNNKIAVLNKRFELKDIYLKADFSHVDCLQEDKKAKAETDKTIVEKLDIMYKSGLISKGDYRAELGYIVDQKEYNEYYVEPAITPKTV